MFPVRGDGGTIFLDLQVQHGRSQGVFRSPAHGAVAFLSLRCLQNTVQHHTQYTTRMQIQFQRDNHILIFDNDVWVYDGHMFSSIGIWRGVHTVDIRIRVANSDAAHNSGIRSRIFLRAER